MSTITPQYTESNLSGTLTTSLTTSATTITAEFVDRITGEQRTPQSSTKLFIIDKGSEQFPNANYEIIICTSHSTDANGVTTLTGCTRGLAFYGVSLAAGTGKTHISGAEIGTVDVHFLWNLLVGILDGSYSPPGFKIATPITFESLGVLADRVFATTAARDAALPAPVDGTFVAVTGDGVFYSYLNGSWSTVGNGAVLNATTAASGKVRIETQATFDAGTATVGGDPAVPQADIIQYGIQKNSQRYATTAGGTTAYTLTLTPAIAAYVDGMEFDCVMNATNTGSSTIAINGLSALTFKKGTNQNVAAGDLPSGSIVKFVVGSSGTTAVILSISSPYAFLTTKGDLPVATAANTITRQGVGSNDQVLIADSAQSTNVKWGATPLTSANFDNGNATRGINDASGTQAISHNLGKSPTRILITAFSVNATGQGSISFSDGVYNGAGTDHCSFYILDPQNSSHANGQASAVIKINAKSGGGVSGELQVATVSAVSSTTFTLSWTKTGTPTGSDILFTWKAEA